MTTDCFDRIMTHLETINLQSFWMPSELTDIRGEFSEISKYYINTGIGTSETCYSHSKLWKVFDTGQSSVTSMYI